MRNHFLRAGGVPSSSSGGSGPAAFDGVTTNLEVHYDYGNTNCWTGNKSDNAADYTINNLANSNHDSFLRRYNGSQYQHGTAGQSVLTKESDGGGCLQLDPSQYSDNTDKTASLHPGTWVSTDTDSIRYNYTARSGSDNLYNGLGTGTFTHELWVRPYSESGSSAITFFSLWMGKQGVNSKSWQLRFYGPADSTYPNKFRIYNGSAFVVDWTAAGAPSSGSGWCDWSHIVYSRTYGTNTTKIYVNNSLQDFCSDTIDYDELRAGYPAYLVVNDTKPKFQNAIYRFYKGKALSSSEVTTNWNDQKSRFGH
jgi:hypothetical protein